MKMKCIIVDDEPLAQRVIEKYADDVSFLEIVAQCSNAMEAMDVLHRETADLVFLDINMPGLTGIDFLRSSRKRPLVIITTAYAEYAVEGYELDVVDYLMKPFSFERFLKAVEKARGMISTGKAGRQPVPKDQEGETSLFIKSGKKTYRVSLDEILYIEALGDYVKIYTDTRMIVTYQSLKNLESMLPPGRFPRIHKSFIISLPRVDLIENSQVRIRDKVLPIGSNYKAELEKLIQSI